MKKFIYTLCLVSLFGAGLSSCSDDAAEIVPTQQQEVLELMTDDETRVRKPK